MKNVFLTILFLYIPLTLCSQSLLCGEWSGVYHVSVADSSTDVKRIIRIDNSSGKYIIRMKQIYLEQNRTNYSPDCIVTSFDDSSISFYENYPKEYESDYSDSKWVATKSNMHWKVRLEYGVLRLSNFGSFTIFYDQYGNTEDVSLPPYTMYNMNLYKDSTDW